MALYITAETILLYFFFVLFLKDIEPKGENTYAETVLVCDTNAAKL